MTEAIQTFMMWVLIVYCSVVLVALVLTGAVYLLDKCGFKFKYFKKK